jgi:hypothetical protein
MIYNAWGILAQQMALHFVYTGDDDAAALVEGVRRGVDEVPGGTSFLKEGPISVCSGRRTLRSQSRLLLRLSENASP